MFQLLYEFYNVLITRWGREVRPVVYGRAWSLATVQNLPQGACFFWRTFDTDGVALETLTNLITDFAVPYILKLPLSVRKRVAARWWGNIKRLDEEVEDRLWWCLGMPMSNSGRSQMKMMMTNDDDCSLLCLSTTYFLFSQWRVSGKSYQVEIYLNGYLNGSMNS